MGKLSGNVGKFMGKFGQNHGKILVESLAKVGK